MKPAAPSELHATRLLDQVRERIRYKHYSLRSKLDRYMVSSSSDDCSLRSAKGPVQPLNCHHSAHLDQMPPYINPH